MAMGGNLLALSAVVLVLVAASAQSADPQQQGAFTQPDPAQGQQQQQDGGSGPDNSESGQAPLAQLRLGFMMPFPSGDSAIPPRVADEWLSAAKLALSLLAPTYESLFSVEYFVANSNCSRESSQKAAEDLVADEVHAVVGPACSESVAGADTVLRVNNIPYISFAATADAFSTAKYPTFFRTAFSDFYQAQAIAAVAKNYHLKSLYIFYTEELYGKGLDAAIKRELASSDPDVSVTSIPVPYPPPTSQEDFQALFEGVESKNASTAVILATTPLVAKNILLTALGLDKLKYPWWYLGTDGTTTFDLIGAGANTADLASALQGEIGVGPFDGVWESGSPVPGFAQFYNFWAHQPYAQYPGLLSLPAAPRFVRPRSYVVNLIDAIWTFHEVARILLSSGHTLARANLVGCLRGLAPCKSSPVSFQGASGWVAFNTTSGDRLALNPSGAAGPEQYKIQNFVGASWKYLGSWKYGNGEGLSGANVLGVTRPGPIPPGADVLANITQAQPYDVPADLLINGDQVQVIDPYSYPTNAGNTAAESGGSTASSSGMNTGSLVAIVVLSVLLSFTSIAAIVLWIRTRKRPDHNFTRMI